MTDRMNAAAFAIAASVFVILACRASIVWAIGSPIPFWDEWDAQGATLLIPLAKGEYSWLTIFNPHNEHRLTTGRLVWILSYLLSGGKWNVLTTMYINIIIYCASCLVLSKIASQALPFKSFIFFLFASTTAFCLPFGWENLLWSMQSVAYMLILTSLIAIALLVDARPFSSRWWLGTGLAILSYFSMAAGALTLVPIMVVRIMQISLGNQPADSREFIAIAIHTGLTTIFLGTIPRLEYGDGIASSSVADFTLALVHLLGFPFESFLPFAIFNIVPATAVMILIISNRRKASNAELTLIATYGWCLLNVLAFAWGRANGGLASRYADILILMNLTSLALLFSLVGTARCTSLASIVFATTSTIQFFAAPVGMSALIHNKVISEADRSAKVAEYLITGASSSLAGPGVTTPYPRQERLANLIDVTLALKLLDSAILIGQENGRAEQ